jgi:4-hydroxy-2-oxoheptanedioate aldolase
MAMRRNLLREEKLDAGKPTVGTHILSAWPTLVELIGHSKQYDYVEFTAEYAPFTMHDLDNLGRSFELMNMAGMIKIEQTQYTPPGHAAIGAGFQSVLFADIRTVEDAKLAVDAVRAESTMVRGVRGRGRLGVGMRRDVRHGSARRNACLCRCVERRGDRHHGSRRNPASTTSTAILSVPGIDMVQFGASDFSMSIGKTGQYSHPEVLEAELKTIKTALKKGKHPRVELRDPSAAGKYLEMGVKHSASLDVRILADWWDTKGAEMRKLLRTKPKKSAPAKQAPARSTKAKANGRAHTRGNYA